MKLTVVRTSAVIDRSHDDFDIAELEAPGDGFIPRRIEWPNEAMPRVYVIWQLLEPE